ncbi:MAG: hypothetical protein ACOX6J_00215 [Oscillospiraceae bacterium]|jgi:adenylate cyclase
MEIERKWMVHGWPDDTVPLIGEYEMKQGYVTVRPTVRIREEKPSGKPPKYILCLKSGRGLVRKEIEIEISQGKFSEIEDLIGLPLIGKIRRVYLTPDGMKLEVNHVDEGMPTEFWYAEIEFGTEKEAREWDPSAHGLGDYLRDDVTEVPGSSMGEYWLRTRKPVSGE